MEKTLAGQPQEPPWQAFPAPSADQQDAYAAYPQSGAQGYAQGYAPPTAGYPAPSYALQDRAFADQDQGYPGLQGRSQPAQQWQAAADLPPAGAAGAARAARAKGDSKGFFGALFDFSFASFVTPKIIKVLYVLITIWTLLWALIFLRVGFKYGGVAGGIFTLVIVDPILVVLTLGAYRMVLELFMAVHRMHEDLRALRERGDGA